MKPPPIRRHDRSRSGRPDQRGITIILVAISMVGILAMAALSIDVITLYLARLEAQRSADAAALTAARIISISGLTGDPTDASDSWEQICAGETSPASQAAHAVASQNTVAGSTATTITVNYSAGNAKPREDCTRIHQAFGVNPMVTVQVTRTALPTIFARMWGAPTNGVTATAMAEAFNPSNSGNVGNTDTDAITPVQPRCVKPWIVPNRDPGNPAGCAPGACNPFVGSIDGSIQHGGISPIGVIGETFTLFADCGGSAGATPCAVTDNPPKANLPLPGPLPLYNGFPAPPPPNLEYLPGAVPASSVAVPACGDVSSYQKAVAGCDQTTAYQCGVTAGGPGSNTLDLSINPGGSAGDTAAATQCLIRQASLGLASGDADSLTTAFPYKINAGTSNPVAAAGVLTTSNSIVSFPIYDGTTLAAGTTPPVTIVGFLQVFINYVNTDGSLNATVLNVAGCGNGTGTPRSFVTGSSPVPVRLITPR